jgi:hypothetical protein
VGRVSSGLTGCSLACFHDDMYCLRQPGRATELNKPTPWEWPARDHPSYMSNGPSPHPKEKPRAHPPPNESTGSPVNL